MYSKYSLQAHSLQAQSCYRHQNSRVPTFPRQNVFVMGTSTPRYRHTKNHFVPITSCDVIQNADVSGYWGGVIIDSDGGSGPFPAHNIFSTLKHGVTSLPRRGSLYRKWSFMLVARSCVKYLGLHLYLEFEKRLEYN